uniref:Uncharacterized protein n=1 Tax=Arundo donax TaxID=35708 RepID=A0A0A9BX06_ARUDO
MILTVWFCQKICLYTFHGRIKIKIYRLSHHIYIFVGPWTCINL